MTGRTASLTVQDAVVVVAEWSACRTEIAVKLRASQGKPGSQEPRLAAVDRRQSTLIQLSKDGVFAHSPQGQSNPNAQ